MDGPKMSQDELVEKLKHQVALENIELLLMKILNISPERLKAKMIVLKNYEIDDIIPVVNNNIFQNVYNLLQTALTIPISSACCERSFSVIRRLKNWTRNTMTNDRLTKLSILHIERDLSHVIESEKKMSRLCFNKCIIKPGPSLDSTEQKCVSMCMDRYMETVSLVSKSFGERLMAESQNMH